MPDGRPTWQIDDCPTWCDGGHREDDRPDDRIHVRMGVAVPVTVRDPLSGRAVEEQLELALWRRDGDWRTWLHVGATSGNRLEVAAPDAANVLRELLALVGVDGRDAVRELSAALAQFAAE